MEKTEGLAVPSEQAALAEYSACQAHATSLRNQMWQATAFYLGAAVAGAAILADVAPTTANAILLSVFALSVIVLVEIWRDVWERHEASRRILFRRMGEIESSQGMRQHTYFEILRDWPSPCDKDYDLKLSGLRTRYAQTVSPAEFGKLENTYRKYPVPRVSRLIARIIWVPPDYVPAIIARVIEVGWVLLAIGKWIDSFL